jgi:hypothetical protein
VCLGVGTNKAHLEAHFSQVIYLMEVHLTIIFAVDMR